MLDQLRAERDAARQRIYSEIGRAALNLETARKQVEFYETKLLPDAERVRQLAIESYRAGQTGILSVIDANRNAREVRQAEAAISHTAISIAAMEPFVSHAPRPNNLPPFSLNLSASVHVGW